MVYKYKIDHVKNTDTLKCRLCLRGDWQKEESVDFFKYKTYSTVLDCRENRALYSLAAANLWYMFSSDITQAFTYGKLVVPLFCHPPPGFDCPPGTVLGLNYCLYGAKRAPARLKRVSTEFMIAEGFTAVNDSQTDGLSTKKAHFLSVLGSLMTCTTALQSVTALMTFQYIVRFASGLKSVLISNPMIMYESISEI
jgi:hypothetical protein